MADTCPDCGRERPEHYWDDEDEFCFATGTTNNCQPRTIIRLRARVAELEQAHSEQVAERGHLRYGARFLVGMLRRYEGSGLLVPEAEAWLEAERARQTKDAKREAGEKPA